MMVAYLNLLGSVGDLCCFSNTLSMLVIKICNSGFSFIDSTNFKCFISKSVIC